MKGIKEPWRFLSQQGSAVTLSQETALIFCWQDDHGLRTPFLGSLRRFYLLLTTVKDHREEELFLAPLPTELSKPKESLAQRLPQFSVKWPITFLNFKFLHVQAQLWQGTVFIRGNFGRILCHWIQSKTCTGIWVQSTWVSIVWVED